VELVRVVLLTEAPSMHISADVLRRTQYRTLVGPLENAVLCCALFTKPYHSNDGAVLLRVCVVMGKLLHSNEHLQISTVADRLSTFATCGRIPWKAPTRLPQNYTVIMCSLKRCLGQHMSVTNSVYMLCSI
jgi:hypothetical protein